MHAWSWRFINLHRITSAAPWSDVVLWHVSICMVVYHKMAVSPGNNNNANTIGSNSPHPPRNPASCVKCHEKPFDVAQTATQKW